jgi:hypothetical protein
MQGLSWRFWAKLGSSQLEMRWSPLAVAKVFLDALLAIPVTSSTAQHALLFDKLCLVLEEVLVSAQEAHNVQSVLLFLPVTTPLCSGHYNS